MTPRLTRAVAARILHQFRHDRRTLVLLFVAPIVILALFDILFRGGSTNPSVDVVDLDRGPLGAAVTASIERSSQVDASPTDLDTAARHLSSGSTAAYIVFPADFSARATGQLRIAPQVHLEGTQPSLSQPVLLALNQSLASTTGTLLSGIGLRTPTIAIDLAYLHGGPDLDTLDYFGAGFVGIVVFFLVFVVTIISFLRERSQGTLERLMASPLRRGDIVVGYMIGFGVLATVQSAEVLTFALYVLHLHNDGSVAIIAILTLLMTVAAVNLGILLSMFATTEFQAVQFIPLAIVPQVLLSGIVFPVSTEPSWLQVVSNVLPLTYGVAGLRDIMLKGVGLASSSMQLDVAVLLAFVVALVVGAAMTLRREVA